MNSEEVCVCVRTITKINSRSLPPHLQRVLGFRVWSLVYGLGQ
jgi:hypothetical protein